jgi:hypothetical protein
VALLLLLLLLLQQQQQLLVPELLLPVCSNATCTDPSNFQPPLSHSCCRCANSASCHCC